MKKIIEGIAQEAAPLSGRSLDLSAVNEVVIRSVVHGFLKGKSPRYRLITEGGYDGKQVYKYDISIPGSVISITQLRDVISTNAIKRAASVQGRSVLARYLFSIAAFMPDHLEWLLSKIRIADLLTALREVCTVLNTVVGTAKNRNCTVNWQKVYSVCSVKLLNALNTASENDVLKTACAVYTGPACDEISKVRDELRSLLLSGKPLASHAVNIAQNLRFLSNFNPSLARHHKFKKKVHADKSQSVESLIIKPAAVIKSLMSGNGEWEHEVNDKISKYIRKHAYVNAETILALCLLLNQPVELTANNIEALRWPNGKVAYSFSSDFTFFEISENASCHEKLRGGILATKEGTELVNLLLLLHHKRNKCSLAVCYSKLAEEISRIAKSMKENKGGVGCLHEQIAHHVHDAFFQGKEHNKTVLNYGYDIASYFARKAEFLQEFVLSGDYPILIEFVKQSKRGDRSSDFKYYLAKKRESDIVASRSTAEKASRRRTLKFVRSVGEIIGLISAVSGMITMGCVAYARFYNEKAKSLLSAISLESAAWTNVLIAGIVLFSAGIALTVASWISAKGTASAFRIIKNATMKGAKKNSVLPCDNAEHYLAIPESQSSPVLIGYIGSAEIYSREETLQATAPTNNDSVSKIRDKKKLLRDHSRNLETRCLSETLGRKISRSYSEACKDQKMRQKLIESPLQRGKNCVLTSI